MIQHKLTIKNYEPTTDKAAFTCILKSAIAEMLNCSKDDISLLLKSGVSESGAFLFKRHCGVVDHYTAKYQTHYRELVVEIKKKP